MERRQGPLLLPAIPRAAFATEGQKEGMNAFVNK
jgi:hypothetical protein